MKHFAPEQLVDFIREVASDAPQEAIRQHLLSCNHCIELASLYQQIATTAARETSCMTPNGVVRTAKALFHIHTTETGADFEFELLFDSRTQPATAGTRSSVVSARQLLYRIGVVYVDMQVDKEVNSDRASLFGQMLDISQPGHPPVGVPVVLLDRGRSVARTSSDDNGEFQLEFSMKRDLQLSVAVDRDRPVSLPIARPGKITSVASARKERAGKTSMTH